MAVEFYNLHTTKDAKEVELEDKRRIMWAEMEDTRRSLSGCIRMFLDDIRAVLQIVKDTQNAGNG